MCVLTFSTDSCFWMDPKTVIMLDVRILFLISAVPFGSVTVVCVYAPDSVVQTKVVKVG